MTIEYMSIVLILTKKNHHDIYVFGHSHFVSQKKISDDSKYFNCGEWITQSYYLDFDGKKSKLLKF